MPYKQVNEEVIALRKSQSELLQLLQQTGADIDYTKFIHKNVSCLVKNTIFLYRQTVLHIQIILVNSETMMISVGYSRFNLFSQATSYRARVKVKNTSKGRS